MAQVSYGTITITDTTDIDRIVNYYLATSASSGVTRSTSGWTTTIQSMTSTKQYLWNYEKIIGTGEVLINQTDPVIIGRYGQNGTNGVDGNSITSIDEYYQATNSTTNPGSSGWSTSIVNPTSSNKYLWNYQVINYSKTASEGTYADARIIGVYGDTGPQGPQGNPGTNGINTATVYLYQRATSAPSKPSGSLTYTFSSAQITSGTLGNWKQSIGELSGTNPIWVIAAVASSNGTTDTIASSEWSTQIKLAQDGTNGTNGTNGLNQATVYIYKRGDSVTKPNNSTYTFSTGEFTLSDNTWSKTIPSTPAGKPCWVSSAVAIGNGTTATLTWNTPSVLVEDGTDGISPTVTSTSNGVKIVDAAGNETYINNGSNGQSYYTYIRYANDSSGSGMSTSPTGKTYIGVYSGTDTPAPTSAGSYTWSKYVGDNGQSGSPGVSVTQVRELYYLTTGNAPSKPTSSTTIYTDDRVGAWTTVVPSYINNGNYYVSLETTLSNSTKTWSDVILDQALTEACYNAAMANSISQSANENAQGAMSQAAAAQYQAEALDAKLAYFFYPGDSNYPGVYAVSGISGTTFNESSISTYGYNVALKPASISIGYNTIKAVELEGGTPSLKFYVPSKTTQATNPSMVLTSSALTFNKIGTANKAVELTSSALNFYGSSTSSADATLTSTGLKLVKGGLEAGTKNTTDYIYLWSNDDATNHKLTINNHEASDWRIVAGNKFGVDKAGNLYASNAEISGKITASSLTIGSGATVSGLSTSNITGMNDYALQSSLDTEVAQRKAVYAVSTTGATTAAKTTESGTPSGFVLYNGATVTVKFNSANSTTTPTLNVNGTGAKTIKSYTGAALTAAEYTWPAGAAITFTYDGSYWRMQDGGALQAKADAAASASAASTQASAASTSATNASNAKTAAESAKTAAQTAQGAAESAKTAAQTAQSAAETASGQATTAKNDAVSAKTAAQTAQSAAETASGQAQTAASNASQSETNAAASATAAAEVMGGFTILWNYSAFGTSTAGDAYICGFDPATGTKSDANGWVKWNSTKRTITKQQVNPGTIVPYNIPIYIVCRLSSATGTTGTNYMVWYNAGWKYATCPSPTAVGGSWTWTDNRDIILGSFVETGENEVLTECELFNPPWTSKQITTNTTTPTSYIMDTDSNRGITIKPKDSTGNNFLRMNSTAIEFFRNSTTASVMSLTDSVFRMGLEASNHTTINTTGLHLWKGTESVATNEVALFGSSIVLYQPGTNTAAVSITNSGATFTGGIVANSLTISNNGSSYNAWDAINITGYSLDIEVNATGIPSSDIYNRTYLYPHLYHNGTEITLPSNATTAQKQEFYNRFLWYEGDSTTAQQGDYLNKGRISANYDEYWRVTYTFDDGATEGATPTQQVIVDPSTYITRINDNTIKVHSTNWNENTGYVQINNQGNIIATGQIYQETSIPLTSVQLIKW